MGYKQVYTRRVSDKTYERVERIYDPDGELVAEKVLENFGVDD